MDRSSLSYHVVSIQRSDCQTILSEETTANNLHGIRIFHNASQLDAAWRQTFADGSLGDGELARAPDMRDYYDK